MSKLLHIPPQGDDIYLTVDSKVEAILVKNFATESNVGVNDLVYATDRGSIIVSDPKTGEILGILSEPTFDDNCVVNCPLQTLYTDMLAKKYTTTMGCPGNCTFDQFTTALDADTAQNILINQGASSTNQPVGHDS